MKIGLLDSVFCGGVLWTGVTKVFVSSTYADLKEERRTVIQALLPGRRDAIPGYSCADG